MKDKNIAIFCSSSPDIDDKFNQAAREVVRAACLRDYTIYSGGENKGTMKVVADEVISCGGKQKGIITFFLEKFKHPGLESFTFAETLEQRKELLRKDVDCVIVLPGGIGTLDEFISTFELAKLKLYRGKIIVYNVFGFYDGFKLLLDHFVEHKMMSRDDADLLYFPENISELTSLLEQI